MRQQVLGNSQTPRGARCEQRRLRSARVGPPGYGIRVNRVVIPGVKRLNPYLSARSCHCTDLCRRDTAGYRVRMSPCDGVPQRISE